VSGHAAPALPISARHPAVAAHGAQRAAFGQAPADFRRQLGSEGSGAAGLEGVGRRDAFGHGIELCPHALVCPGRLDGAVDLSGDLQRIAEAG
jgi:hypothetical protein